MFAWNLVSCNTDWQWVITSNKGLLNRIVILLMATRNPGSTHQLIDWQLKSHYLQGFSTIQMVVSPYIFPVSLGFTFRTSSPWDSFRFYTHRPRKLTAKATEKSKWLESMYFRIGGCFHPFENNMLVKWDHFSPRIGVKIKDIKDICNHELVSHWNSCLFKGNILVFGVNNLKHIPPKEWRPFLTTPAPSSPLSLPLPLG